MAVSASGFVNNWQAGKSLIECNLRMLLEEDSCDVTFRCGTESHVVKAHLYMLISRSCVFHAMFTGAMAEKSDVKIPDIEPLVFKSFLKFIYTDNIDINADNVTALMYTARKYGVTSLETKCTEFLDRNLNPDNACVILEAAHCFDQKELYEKAMTIIHSKSERSLQSPGFRALSKDLVDEIVGSDDLVADEHVIFSAVNDWSECECIREGRDLTPESKRLVLGDVLMKVRFPLMKPKFLAISVKQSSLLTDKERIMCLDFSVAPEVSSTTFNQTPRKCLKPSKTVSKRRFLAKCGFWTNTGRIDALRFSSNKDMFILGFQLYGAFSGKVKSTYNVTSYFGDEHNVLSCVVQEGTEYTCEGEVFDVIFSRPVSVSAGEWYTLGVKTEGPYSWKGLDGQDELMDDNGVELRFKNSSHSTNHSDVRIGQIPTLIYNLH